MPSTLTPRRGFGPMAQPHRDDGQGGQQARAGRARSLRRGVDRRALGPAAAIGGHADLGRIGAGQQPGQIGVEIPDDGLRSSEWRNRRRAMRQARRAKSSSGEAFCAGVVWADGSCHASRPRNPGSGMVAASSAMPFSSTIAWRCRRRRPCWPDSTTLAGSPLSSSVSTVPTSPRTWSERMTPVPQLPSTRHPNSARSRTRACPAGPGAGHHQPFLVVAMS
jgi:hypothetical protein